MKNSYDAYEYDRLLGTVELVDGVLRVSGPEADYLRRVVYGFVPSARNDTEVYENMPNYFRGTMHLRSAGNVAGIPTS